MSDPETPNIDPGTPRGLNPLREGDIWVYGENGQKFWGKYGAAGLLLYRQGKGVLLQHRVGWSHFGGTWGLPGGAKDAGESAVAAAIREANEEAGIPAELVSVLFSQTLDLGFWSYTTVAAILTQEVEPKISDAESIELRWVQLEEVSQLPLHPGLADSWPTLKERLEQELSI